MIDMYRRLNFFPRWIMATSLGRTNRYVPSLPHLLFYLPHPSIEKRSMG
jgi:hypothetical protein